MNTNDYIRRMMEAVSAAQPADRPPPGFVSRREIQEAMNCSEMTALRYIKKMEKVQGFEKVVAKIDGKLINYYKVSQTKGVQS
jgi:hypothetical protein